MGMYDIVVARCPRCGEELEFQSKGGDCSLSRYDISEAPSDVLSDADRHDVLCGGCGSRCSCSIEKKVVAKVVII